MLLSCIAACSLLALPSDTPVVPNPSSPQLVVRVPGSGAERLSQLIGTDGKVASRTPGTDEYRIVLKSPKTLDQVRRRIAAAKDMQIVRFFGGTNGGEDIFRSVSELREYIEEREAATRHLGKDAEEAAGVDYLQAYLQDLHVRTFPRDVFDWTALPKALERRQRMSPAKLGGPTRYSGGSSRQWEYLGPNNLDIPYRIYYGSPPLAGRINALAIDPTNSNVYYAGAAAGGVFKSTNAGASWTSLSADWEELPVNCITIDPTNANTIYVGGGDYQGFIDYGFGIRKSTDGGKTWRRIGESTFSPSSGVSKIVIDPEFPNIIVATTAGGAATYGNIYRSTDRGETWVRVLTGDNAVWTGLSMSGQWETGGYRLYATAAGWSGNRIFRSDDRGETWQPVTNPMTFNAFDWRFDIAASQVNPDVVYFLAPSERRMFKSLDSGATWKDITPTWANTYNWSQASYNVYLSASSRSTPSGPVDVLYCGLIDVNQSQDGGVSWRSLGGPSYSWESTIHNDQHTVAFDPRNPGHVLVGNDGGIFRVDYNGATGAAPVTSLNAKLPITMFYTGAWHPTNPSVMIGGTQDNASPASTGNLNAWINPGAGDGTGVTLNAKRPLVQHNGYQGFGYDGSSFEIIRTTDGWQSSTSIRCSTANDSILFVPPLATHPANPDLLLAGSRFLNLFDEATKTWSPRLGNKDFGSPLLFIAGAPSDVKTIYVCPSNGNLWVTKDRGANWRQIGNGLPNAVVTSVSVNPTNPNDVLVTMGGQLISHVYQCADTAATTPVWTDADGTGQSALPDIIVNTLARDLDAPLTTWWVGTDIGVFQTKNAGASWTNATVPLGLPNVRVNVLAAIPGTRYLNAATYGRGMWRLYLPQYEIGIANIGLTPNSAQRGTTVALKIQLQTKAGPDGAILSLQSSSPSITLPASIKIPAGKQEATVAVVVPRNAAAGTVTLTVSSANIMRIKFTVR